LDYKSTDHDLLYADAAAAEKSKNVDPQQPTTPDLNYDAGTAAGDDPLKARAHQRSGIPPTDTPISEEDLMKFLQENPEMAEKFMDQQQQQQQQQKQQQKLRISPSRIPYEQWGLVLLLMILGFYHIYKGIKPEPAAKKKAKALQQQREINEALVADLLSDEENEKGIPNSKKQSLKKKKKKVTATMIASSAATAATSKTTKSNAAAAATANPTTTVAGVQNNSATNHSNHISADAMLAQQLQTEENQQALNTSNGGDDMMAWEEVPTKKKKSKPTAAPESANPANNTEAPAAMSS
jgi:hypothetical protein